MKYRVYSESDIIDKSRELIHAFMNRKMLSFAELLDKNFVWIGDYAAQYIQGRDAFLQTITAEFQMPPIELSREEYSILTHERHTWVSYGRCTVTAQTSPEHYVASGIHFNFVWKQEKDAIFLLMASANHVLDAQKQDMPLDFPNPEAVPADKEIPQARVFDQIAPEDLTDKGTPKMRIRDITGNLHFLYPNEVLYANSNDKLCTIHTIDQEFCGIMSLRSLEQPGFLRIHSRYLVNLSYVTAIRRYAVTLTDGTSLPIGRDRYKEVQAAVTEG